MLRLAVGPARAARRGPDVGRGAGTLGVTERRRHGATGRRVTMHFGVDIFPTDYSMPVAE